MSRNGTYIASISNWDFGVSKKGDPQFIVEFDIVGLPGATGKVSPLPNGQLPFTGSLYMSFGEKSKDWTFRRLEALGWTGDDLDQLNPGNPGSHDFTGKQFKCEVTESEETHWQDPTRTVKRVNYDIVIPKKAASRFEARDDDTLAQLKADLAKYRGGKAKTPDSPRETYSGPAFSHAKVGDDSYTPDAYLGPDDADIFA